MSQFSCFIFDLDGVIADTAKHHFIAWNWICDQLSIDFSKEKYEKLKGVSREDSLDIILNLGNLSISQEEKNMWLKRKNKKYLELVQDLSQEDILPGVRTFLNELKINKKKIALGSSSRNAKLILDILNLTPYFEAIIDGNAVNQSKPNPEVFLKGAEACNCLPSETIVFEDSIAGIKAANKAGFYSVGIGDEELLSEASLNAPGFENLNLSLLNSRFELRHEE